MLPPPEFGTKLTTVVIKIFHYICLNMCTTIATGILCLITKVVSCQEQAKEQTMLNAQH